VNLQQNTASSLFLEGQVRSLQETTRRLGLPAGMGKVRSIADLQARLQEAGTRATASLVTAASLKPYVPAILHLARQDQASGMSRVDAILLPPDGEAISRSVEVSTSELKGLIASFQKQLSRREPVVPRQPDDAGATLSRLFIEPLLPSLESRGITALLLEVDRGLQAVPFGALHIDRGLLGEAFALTITPSLGLIDLDPSRKIPAGDEARLLLAGASKFSDRTITPLPMVRQELETLAREHPSTLIVDSTFSPQSLKARASDISVDQLHIATHAEFLPGQTSSGRLFTPNDALSLADLGRSLRSRPSSRPLDLISLSGCVTALGDEQSELGFVGMSLQAGARSGLGSLWEVDDAATAAFFIQYFRNLKLGLSKDQALQATQSAFRNGDVALQGDRLVGPGKRPLITGLSREEQTLFSQGLRHPYYWAGMILTGSPW
jgi:CHAT domain-containing protein